MSEFLAECLGDKLDKLPPVIRKAHIGKVRLEGHVAIKRGNGLAKILCNILGMPPEKERAWLVVEGDHLPDHMLWNRAFDGFAMNSWFQKDGTYLIEKLGPIHMWLILDVVDGVLSYKLFKTKFFGIPIPAILSPKVMAEEWQEKDSYMFRVSVSLPVVGMLVSYFGEMKQVA